MAKRTREEVSDEELNKAYKESLASEELTDKDLNQVYDQLAGGGSPLFSFTFQKAGPRGNWKNVIEKSTFNAKLKQLRQPTTFDNIGDELTAALTRSIQEQISQDPTLQPYHHLHFNMQASGYNHAFQSTSFTLEEFSNNSPHMSSYLQNLAKKLNSGEKFGKNENFHTELTFIKTPSKGSGHGNKMKPGRKAIETLLHKKKSVIKIKNTDRMCCARAIVTMKSHCHKDDNVDCFRNYENLRDGRPIQEKEAKELHRLAGIEEGPCGIQELDAFQKVLPDYQLKVMAVDSPHMIIFQGPPAPLQILLIKVDDHYHGCSSFAGFCPNRTIAIVAIGGLMKTTLPIILAKGDDVSVVNVWIALIS